MNKGIIGWLAIGVICFTAAWVQASRALGMPQLQAAVVLLLVVAVCYRVAARQAARLVVLRRRRLYKDFWRRDGGGQLTLSKAEEELVVLLGRIKSTAPMTVVVTLGTIVALYYKANMLALVLALGLLFLAAQLHVIVRGLDRGVPADPDRAGADEHVPPSPSDRYAVRIDLSRVHDFIQPRVALPFWSPAEAQRWLVRCGFRPLADGRWEGSRHALSCLDADELLAVEPIVA